MEAHSLFSISDTATGQYTIVDGNYHIIEFLQSDLARQLNTRKIHLTGHLYQSYWDFENLMIGDQYYHSDQAIKDEHIIMDYLGYNCLDTEALIDLNEIYSKYYNLDDMQFSTFLYYINHDTGASWKKTEKLAAIENFKKAAKYWKNTVLPNAEKEHLNMCYR